MTNTERFLALLNAADAVRIDHGCLLTDWTVSPLTGEPRNGVASFSWVDDEGCRFEDGLDETGIEHGAFISPNRFVGKNREGESITVEFFETTALNAPHAGAAQAGKFFDELLDTFETLTGIADVYGDRTLSDCLYLQQAILKGGFLDYETSDDSCVLDVVGQLPSRDEWRTFIQVEAG